MDRSVSGIAGIKTPELPKTGEGIKEFIKNKGTLLIVSVFVAAQLIIGSLLIFTNTSDEPITKRGTTHEQFIKKARSDKFNFFRTSSPR